MKWRIVRYKLAVKQEILWEDITWQQLYFGYFSHSSQSLADWLRKNMIQV